MVSVQFKKGESNLICPGKTFKRKLHDHCLRPVYCNDLYRVLHDVKIKIMVPKSVGVERVFRLCRQNENPENSGHLCF